ncbi:hypothetical protein E2562_027847 [Oryza meyeriana var. granulata]|uniref:Uncharacterized protein n=1 Tax=Oryza meyeriana var. granulata TaxID=110450 RepID=A0A6G1DNT2_9ORYZ|nr:hypothetical protein E2562_027847 [Oryza meyeriana var. granulata]
MERQLALGMEVVTTDARDGEGAVTVVEGDIAITFCPPEATEVIAPPLPPRPLPPCHAQARGS